jgi:hypothetical protein
LMFQLRQLLDASHGGSACAGDQKPSHAYSWYYTAT